MWNHFSNGDPSKIRIVKIVSDDFVRSHATSIYNVDTDQEEYIIKNQQHQNQSTEQSQIPSFIPQQSKTTTYVHRKTSPIFQEPKKEDIKISTRFNYNYKRDYKKIFKMLSNEVSILKQQKKIDSSDLWRLENDLESFAFNEENDFSDDEPFCCSRDLKNDHSGNEKNDHHGKETSFQNLDFSDDDDDLEIKLFKH